MLYVNNNVCWFVGVSFGGGLADHLEFTASLTTNHSHNIKIPPQTEDDTYSRRDGPEIKVINMSALQHYDGNENKVPVDLINIQM